MSVKTGSSEPEGESAMEGQPDGAGVAGETGMAKEAEVGGPVKKEREAGFPPPDEPIMVFCLHCGKEYMSSEMVAPSGKRTPLMIEGMWWCGTPGCNAGGFGLDIFPSDPEWKDPKGLLQIITDDEEDEEFEWDDEEDL